METKFDSNISSFSNIDFLGIVQKFNLEKPPKDVKLLGVHSESPDDHFYKLLCDKEIYYLYEVDYISGLDYQIGYIKKVLGSNIELIPVKSPLSIYDKSISKYITDYSGSQPYYHKFLIKEIEQ